jgi:CRISPR-associated protein Cmr6
MSKGDRGVKGRRKNEILRDCIDGNLTNLINRNVITALVNTFVKCYEFYDESEVGVSYTSIFSRDASIKLYEEFKCSKIGNLLVNSLKYINELYNVAREVFDAVFLLKLQLVSRLTISTRNPAIPLEISISWDPVLNLPYIPSSSLKGIARSYIESIKSNIDGVPITTFFGGSSSVGLAIFFDTYPIECSGDSLIEPDVITPHYKEVDGGVDEVSSSPTPIVYPTIAPNTVFATIIALKYSYEEGKIVIDPKKAYEFIRYVQEALTQGIGAKTTLGYGRIRPILSTSNVRQR